MTKANAQYWMVKQEPTAYSWADFVKDGRAEWTGVRNYQARNHLRQMRRGDRVLFYHSVVGKEVVGLAEVIMEAYPDPTATEGDWDCVALAPIEPLARPVTLAEIKATPALAELALLRQSRLSVMPVKPAEFHEIWRMANSGGSPVGTKASRLDKKSRAV